MNTLVMLSSRQDIDRGNTLPAWTSSNGTEADFLDQLLEGVTQCTNVRDLAQHAVNLLIDNTRAESCSIMLLTEDSESLTITAAKSLYRQPEHAGPPMAFKIGQGIAGWVVNNNSPVRLADATKDHRFVRGKTPSVAVSSLLSYPLTASGKVLGVLNLSSSAPGMLTGDDEHIVQLACKHLGKAFLRIAEFDRRESRLAQSENVIAAGGLLAGIVHELNNPITTIHGFSEVLLRDAASTPGIEKIYAEAQRSIRIVRNVLNLCRPESGPRGAVDLYQTIRDAADLVRYQLRQHVIRLDLNLADPSPKVAAYSGELTQVFLNLFTNAIQAIASARAHGTIRVSVSRSDKGIRISVQDDGPGVSREHIDHIFQPFYTTKKDGTGLGLSLSRSIVQKLGGDLRVESGLQAGATLTIDLPVLDRESGHDTETESSGGRRVVGNRSVLVVDDEEFIAEFVDMVLRDRGFNSHRLSESSTVIDLLRENDYDLLVCDYHMPGQGAHEFLEWLRDAGKKTRVLVVSGDVFGNDIQGRVESLGGRFLPKPFSIDELLEAVDTTLTS